MAATQQQQQQSPLTLYTAKICPWAQRATLALHEVKGDYEISYVEIALDAKPAWYDSTVNVASKVPVLQLGPNTDQARENPATPKVAESHVILELVSDLYPGQLLPEHDPRARAEQRYFIERFHQVVSTPYFNLLLHGSSGSAQCILVGIREIQKLLQKRGGPLAFGSTYSMADCGVAPFVGRIFATGRAGLLSGDVYQKLTTDPEFAPFKAYHEALTSRPSWNATFDEDYIVNGTKKRVEASRAQAKANKKE